MRGQSLARSRRSLARSLARALSLSLSRSLFLSLKSQTDITHTRTHLSKISQETQISTRRRSGNS